MNRFKYLPQALQVMCVSLTLGPIGTALAIGLNFSAASALPWWYLTYLGVTYAALPWVLAVLVVRRHAFFLYTFGVQCCLLLAHLFIGAVDMPPYLRFTHYAFAMIASALALMMINRDILFPFIFEKYRGFRRAPRIELNQRVTVSMARIAKSFDAMIEDASLTGLSVYGFEDAMSEVLTYAQRGEPLIVTYRSAKTTLQVHGWFLWSAQASSVVKIGFRASDVKTMEAFFDVLGVGAKRAGWRRQLHTLWGRKGVRRALNYGFAAVILAALMVPVVNRGADVAAPAPQRPDAATKAKPHHAAKVKPAH